jgi:hydroxymethylbilane synthase
VLIYRDPKFLNSQLSTPTSELTEWSPGQSERRGFKPKIALKDLPAGAIVATSSTRRKAQLLVANPKIKVVDIRGNVVTRMEKLMNNADFDATVLALAGLTRLDFRVTPEGKLQGDAVPDGLLATILDLDVMLPCVGQGAIGIEIRAADERIEKICERLNHFNTLQSVTAERAFLSALGGGCQSPVGAHAEVISEQLRMRAVSFIGETVRRAEAKRPIKEAAELGQQLAVELK